MAETIKNKKAFTEDIENIYCTSVVYLILRDNTLTR